MVPMSVVLFWRSCFASAADVKKVVSCDVITFIPKGFGEFHNYVSSKCFHSFLVLSKMHHYLETILRVYLYKNPKFCAELVRLRG